MSTAHIFVRVLGLKASSLKLISNVRPLMRSIQFYLLHFWKPSFKDLHFVDHLNWWLKRVHTLKGNPFQPREATVTLTTDASYIWFGKLIGKNNIRGEKRKVSITWIFR